MNNISRSWLLGGWVTAVAVLVSWSAVMDAKLSTSAILLVTGVAPAAVAVLLGIGRPPPTVAEILHSVNAKIGRR